MSKGIPLSARRWIPWIRKIFWAIADQGFTSGSNFVSSILLARWLRPEDYGAYALALSVFFFLAGFHHNLLLSPMSVFGPTIYRDQQGNYIRILLWLQVGFGLFAFAGLGGSALVAASLGQREFSHALTGLMCAAPAVLLLWMTRTAYYIYLSPARAARGSFFYSILQLTGLVLISVCGWLSSLAVFLVMALSAAISGSYLAIGLHPTSSKGGATIAEVCRAHWRYGRWEVGAGLVYGVSENTWVVFAGACLGLGEAGALKAITNLLQPLSQITVALSRLAVPHVSDVTTRGGRRAAASRVRSMALLLAGGAVVYCGIMSAFYRPIFHFSYAGKYIQFAALVPFVGIGLVFQTTYQAFAVGLRAVQAPNSVFTSYAVGAAVTVVIGIPIALRFGFRGMVAGSITSSFAVLCAGWYLFDKHMFEPKETLRDEVLAHVSSEA